MHAWMARQLDALPMRHVPFSGRWASPFYIDYEMYVFTKYITILYPYRIHGIYIISGIHYFNGLIYLYSADILKR